MTLAERLSEYVRACFTGIWVQSFEHDDAIVEIARLCRQQRWSLATWDIDRGLSLAGRPTTARARPSAPPTRWRRSRRSARSPRRTARRCWSCGTSTGSWAASRSSRPSTRRSPPASRTGRSSWSSRRSSRSRSSWSASSSSSSTTCPAATSSGRSPARSPPSPGELPDGDGLDAVLDAAAGLTRVEAENAFSPLAGPPRPGRPGRAVGAQGPDAEEERPADAPPRRRDLRRPGRPGRPEGVLPPLPGRQAVQLAGASSRRPAARRLRARARARSARPWATRTAGRR